MDKTTLIGVAGAALVLLAFVMNQLHKWKDDDLVYDLVNLIGGTLLVTYAYLLESYPFLALNGVWALVSLRDVIMGLKRK